LAGRSYNLHNKKSYKIGTRGSLLALTQCNQVKDQLEKLTGDNFELEIIKTQGDLITNAPLWQLDGKDFFTKELDEALISGKVDLVVHSYKDLGSERPNPIMLAAVTKRTYAHDILLIKNSTIGKLQNKKEFIVGTSSPRRMVNLEKNLKDYIPGSNDLIVSTKVLRGNVNTRISKLVNDEFDAIVIALPGIERLALTESSKKELENLLNGMNFLILPQSIFPSSASQGALGIECLKERTDNGELLSKLKLI
jgi:hydroxymethylbilane synthase